MGADPMTIHHHDVDIGGALPAARTSATQVSLLFCPRPWRCRRTAASHTPASANVPGSTPERFPGQSAPVCVRRAARSVKSAAHVPARTPIRGPM
jgi:hypothetical protein